MSLQTTLLALLVTLGGQPGWARTIHERESQYHYIAVDEAGSVRTLRFRRAGTNYDESAVDTKQPLRMVLSYSKLMFAGFLFCPEPKDLLMLGLGAGVCPRVMNHYFPQARFDVVELDPAVKEVAQQYFGFKENDHLQVMLRDGRVGVKVLARQKRKYDVIMLDAFRGGYIPYHLTTKEFLEECRGLLKPGGVLVSNLWPSLLLYEYERRTMGKVFAQQEAFGQWGNKIVVCLQKPHSLTDEDLQARARNLTSRLKLSFDLTEVVDQRDRRRSYNTKGQILTDDYAPANVLNSIPRE